MEVTVLEAHNAPKKPVVEFRAGTGSTSLRHAQLALDTPFHVPFDRLQDSQIKVSLYTQLGTQTIPDADELESVCNVPVRTPDGKCSQVKLHIRRQVATGLNFKSSNAGVEDYLNHHQLEARIQSLFEMVLKKQPRNPYRCMIEELQQLKQAGEDTACPSDELAQSSVPKVPVAPAEAPPKNARPSPAAKTRNLKPSESERVENDTKAAVAEMVKEQDAARESSSLSNARQAHRYQASKVLSNLELAHEVMRMCIRRVVSDMASQSSSLGPARNDARMRAIEHSANVKMSHHVVTLVMRSAYNRLEARSLGIMGGGHTKSDEIVFRRDPAVTAQGKALTESVVKMVLRKASQELS